MNYGLARIIKESLYQALRNTMYIIIGAFALTIYSMFVVNDKGAHSALAVGMLFSQCIIYIGGYVIVLFMICYTCQNISLAVSFSCTRKQAVVVTYIIEFLMGIFLIIVSVAGALTAGLMGVDISLGIWILQEVLVMLICIAVANIGSSITLKVGRIGYMSMVLIMGFVMGIMTVFIKSTLAAGYSIMGGWCRCRRAALRSGRRARVYYRNNSRIYSCVNINVYILPCDKKACSEKLGLEWRRIWKR